MYVRLLECSPESCLALGNHCEEKREKFITRKINNKSPSHFSFDTGTVSNFEKPARAFFFHLGEWRIVSYEGKHLCSKETCTILSHLPGTLKVSWWLTYPFLFKNMTLFIIFVWPCPSMLSIANLDFLPKREIYLDLSIKNGFIFVVEICGFSVFAYNFYSFESTCSGRPDGFFFDPWACKSVHTGSDASKVTILLHVLKLANSNLVI